MERTGVGVGPVLRLCVGEDLRVIGDPDPSPFFMLLVPQKLPLR